MNIHEGIVPSLFRVYWSCWCIYLAAVNIIISGYTRKVSFRLRIVVKGNLLLTLDNIRSKTL